MSRSLGTLTLDLIAKTGGFEAGMDKAARVADKKTREMQRHAEARAKAIENAFVGIAGKLAIGLSAGAFAGFIKGGIDAADNINDLSQKIGVSVEALAGYKLAAEQSGTSLEGIGTAAKILNKNLADNDPLLKQLGINATDANGAMIQLADLFASMPDGAQKTAIAMQLMGKSGTDMIPMLNGGGAALRGMLEQGQKIYPITKQMAEQADKFNDQLAILKTQAEGAGISLANSLLPGMNDILTKWNDAITLSRQHGGFIGLVMGGINPTGDNAENLRKIREQIAQTEKDLKGMKPGTAFNTETQQKLERLKAIKKTLLEIQKREADALGAPYADYKVAQTPNPAKPITSATGTAAAPKLDVLMTGPAKQYQDYQKSLNADFEEANRAVLRGLDEEFQAGLQAAEDYKQRLESLVSGTTLAKTEQLRGNIDFLDQAFFDGKIGAQQYEEAVAQALGSVPEVATDAQQTFLDLNTVANDAARGMADSFVNFLFDPVQQDMDDMVRDFIKSIAKMIVQAEALALVRQGLSAMGFTATFAKGGAFDQSGLQAFASGGVVNKPTFFKFASGGSFKSGVMGEAGPEAILPLKRGSDGKLGVTTTGSGSSGTVVNITVNQNGTDSKESSNGSGNAMQLAKKLKGVVMEVIVTEKRPGGLLYA